MSFLRKNIWVYVFVLLTSFSAFAEKVQTHYSLKALINPLVQGLEAQTTIRFSKPLTTSLRFRLYKDLEVESLRQNIALTKIQSHGDYSEYEISPLESGIQELELKYIGTLFSPVIDDVSSGLISSDGVALFGSSYWYPHFENTAITFELQTHLPADWKAVSQGSLLQDELRNGVSIQTHQELKPQEQIYLIANHFFVFEKKSSQHSFRVYLRQDEPELAKKYLDLVPTYVEHYSKILAPYPYTSFSIVENFWETGYGMPSFTLLGPTVIRLPFILTTSLPHEILHNWWGNSVYVDYERGNWSEGLTTFMSDYWQSQVQKQDKDYRQKALMSFTDFVSNNSNSDFPLRQFKGRHNSSSQAVGYAKSMMLYVMLEKKLGAEVVKESLRHFYLNNQYQRVSFEELQFSFETVSGIDLSHFFNQWLDRKGAPELILGKVNFMNWQGSYNLSFQILQKQKTAYDLDIPVAITLENGDVYRTQMSMKSSEQDFLVLLPRRPVFIEIDPDFEIFRKIDSQERPATLSSALTQKKVNYFSVLPQAQSLFDIWSQRFDNGTHIYAELKKDHALELPLEGTVVLLGDSPEIRRFVSENLSDYEFSISDENLNLLKQNYTVAEHSSVIVAPLKSNPTRQFIWVRWTDETDIADWAQRLTHYTSFGLLTFKGRPVVLKSAFPAIGGPLKRSL